MDPKSQEILNEILHKRLEELNEDDKGFLRARRMYLTKTQLTDYDEIINPKVVEVAEPKTKKAKK